MVPVSVPPSVPVPVFSVRLTAVALWTLALAPLFACAVITTAKFRPAVGFAPPFTEVIASLVGLAACATWSGSVNIVAATISVAAPARQDGRARRAHAGVRLVTRKRIASRTRRTVARTVWSTPHG